MPQMDPARWRAASARLDDALELTGEQRAQWMTALREQDPQLAADVAGLLEEYDVIRREGFLEGQCEVRPGEAAGDAAGGGAPGELAGRPIGAYRLVSPIGQGGMGVVWLAERCDGQFEGLAAVKLLTIRFGRSDARFRREANILARVTHPNIAHLIDAGVSSDGQPYLVLEHVDGQPIDEYCDHRQLGVRERITLVLEVLGAVAHAHTLRIVHRDIKPPNVLVRTDGHAKLLDFGIAKLLEPDGQPGKVSTLTLEQGAGMTPAYAAPEQVQGGSVTTATDIYALGLLLYVLLTGQHPCDDLTSPADLFKAIVDVDPPPPSACVAAGKISASDLATRAANRATTPDALSRTLRGDLDTIVGTALKKNPLDRYASVGELADDLRRHLGSEPIRARRESFGRRALRVARRHVAVTAAAAAVALTFAAVTGYYTVRPPLEGGAAATSEPVAPAPVTSEPGDERYPNLSPDHTRIAFTSIAPGAPNGRIAIKTLGSDDVAYLTDGADDSNPVWSPDGEQIAFIRSYREPDPRTQICVIPVNAGAARVLHTMGLGLPGLTWWKDTNALLFAARPATSGPFRLAALDLATLDVRLLTNPPPAPQLRGPGDFLPAVGPDGRTIAFVRETHEGRDVFLLDTVKGVESRLTHEKHRIAGLTWAPDGKAIIMSSPRSGQEALYRVSLADGTITRIPNTSDGATHPMADDRAVVYSQAHDDSNIYRVELRARRATGSPRPIIASSRADAAPHISPDGRSIAFVSTRAGGGDIWVASADGSNPRRVTFLPITSGPRWSPDGRSLAFAALAPGLVRPDIWIVDANGGTPRQLTRDPSYDTILSWAADGKSLYAMTDRTGMWEVWNIPADGGPATRVTEGGGLRAQESRDGAFLYYANDVPQVWRRSLRVRSPDQLITTFPTGTHWGGDWVIGLDGLYYLDQRRPGTVAIDFLPFGGTSPRPVRAFLLTAQAARNVRTFAIAPDESWLVWSQDDYRNTDIMMIAHRP
jgi:Tol biopolymer transport system component/serine/threonine protein kinase